MTKNKLWCCTWNADTGSWRRKRYTIGNYRKRGGLNNLDFIKGQIIRWFSHILRRKENEQLKTFFEKKPRINGCVADPERDGD